jgi:hypothetical protein
MIRTDTNPWVLVATKDLKPPENYGMEMYYYYGEDYQWPDNNLTQCQQTISKLTDSSYKASSIMGKMIRIPLNYTVPECHWYLAQQPEDNGHA